MTHPPRIPPRFTRPEKILIFISIVLAAFNLRTAVTSITPLLDSVSKVFGLSPVMVGVLGMLPSISFAIAAAASPMIIRRLNLERTVMLAMTLTVLGLTVRAMSPNASMLFSSSVIALLGMGVGNVVIPPLVKRYFPHRIGSVSVIYLTILQMGTLLPAFLAVHLENHVSWRFSLGVWASFALIALILWIYVWMAIPQTQEQPSLDRQPHEATISTGRVWRSPLAWGITLMFGMTSLNSYAIFTWLPQIFTSAGASREFGGAMVGLFAGLGLLSTLLIPLIATHIKHLFPVIIFCALCFMIAYLGLYFSPMSFPIIWVIVLGLAPSTFPLGLTLINLRTRTQQGSAALSGFMQACGYGTSALGPLIVGLLHSLTHQWLLPFIFLASAVCFMTLGGYIASRRQMLEDTW